jgi:hypothetical protein
VSITETKEDDMAWVIGLADKDEIKRIRKVGWEVKTTLHCGDVHSPPNKGNKMIAVFVDCDVSDLLNMKGE